MPIFTYRLNSNTFIVLQHSNFLTDAKLKVELMLFRRCAKICIFWGLTTLKLRSTIQSA